MRTEEEGRDGDKSMAPEEPEVPDDDVPQNLETLGKPRSRNYITKHMKRYPELYRSDCSIHPSYTDLKNLPYHVVCRQRAQRLKKRIARQLQRDVKHFTMMQIMAIDSVRIDRIFTVGMSPKALNVPDFATEKQRRRINELLRELCGKSPLELWGMHVKNGYIRRITDEEVKSLALEVAGTNVATTYIYCPADRKKTLAIRLPFLTMIIKNMRRYFSFEITILDDKNMNRRFRCSNFQSTTRIRPFSTSIPIGLPGGWNQVQFNLADFTRRAYSTNYVETSRMQIHANCRIRRIYFSDKLYPEDKVPNEYKLLLPLEHKKCVSERPSKEKRSFEEKPEVQLTAESPSFTLEEQEQIKLEEHVETSAPAPSVHMEDAPEDADEGSEFSEEDFYETREEEEGYEDETETEDRSIAAAAPVAAIDKDTEESALKDAEDIGIDETEGEDEGEEKEAIQT